MSPTIVGRAEAPAAPAALQQGEGAEEGGHQQPKPHLATTHIGVKKAKKIFVANLFKEVSTL